MDASSFRSWQDAMGLNNRAAAEALGVHPNTVAKFRREGGAQILRLACAALYHRLEAPFL
ncbi:MAG: hypothetical protein ROR55_21380 [Devosia sp.]